MSISKKGGKKGNLKTIATKNLFSISDIKLLTVYIANYQCLIIIFSLLLLI